jgi:hypothetical protein
LLIAIGFEVADHLIDYYANDVAVPQLSGPHLPELCDSLYGRVIARFDSLSCGKDYDFRSNLDE